MVEPAGNRLAREPSLYLRQHGANPVDWYPWGSEALTRSRQLDRPIFLSIGYSACHWCHVMERESFEDPDVARLLNSNFVCIKVDREERPDLDQIYMAAVQALTGQGGWPMSVFLTPGLSPFYGGTYFPPDDRYGRPSFTHVLEAVIQAWRERRAGVEESARQLTEQIRTLGQTETSHDSLGPELLQGAVTGLARAFDPVHGGFGSAPKFPHPTELRFLLRAWKRFGEERCLDMVRRSLDAMAAGGIYDHLGGGFHRYSTDNHWLVPHFEKMLYDNALLALTYLEAYQATGEPRYKRVVAETIAYVRREMTDSRGGFYSTQDADSEGVEGKYFVWSSSEVVDALGSELADLFADGYGIDPDGNWEGHNILHRVKTDAQLARLRGLGEEVVKARLDEARRRLLEVRSCRAPPARDDKVLTAWNGLMIDALAQAARPLEDPTCALAAVRAAEFVLDKLRRRDGRLFRSYYPGCGARLDGYLDDYAYFANALVSLYEATFEARWIEAALAITGVLLDQFADSGGFFYTGRDHEALLTRPRDANDNATPSGSAIAVMAMLRLAKLTGQKNLMERTETVLRHFAKPMRESPFACSQMLAALDFWLGPVTEFAVVGPPDAQETQQAIRAIGATFRPNKVVALADGSGVATGVIQLLHGKQALGAATIYLCRDFACQAPIVSASALEEALLRSDDSYHH